MTRPLWTPDPYRASRTHLACFFAQVANDWGVEVADFEALHRFSVEAPEKFWCSVRDYAHLTAESWGEQVLVNSDQMPGAAYFPDARLNFAENLLRRRAGDEDAIVFWGEDRVKRRISRTELYDQVSRLAQALEAAGIGPGDRVAGYMPNIPETVIAMLAAVSLGATWSSCSPDFGVQGVLDRLGQIEPKVLVAADGYYYGGKSLDCLEKVAAVAKALPSLRATVIVPYTRDAADVSAIPDAVPLAEFIAPHSPAEIAFRQMPFSHPLYIMFSSGTTGVPKCIVHGAGGTLLKHVCEHLLHSDVKPGDRVFYFTTCGWMMWNWLVSALACDATLLLYDGSPFHPDGNILFDYADAEGMTFFGTSAKYIDALNKAGLKPRETHSLETVRTMASTGSVLAPESFDYVYRDIKADLHLASISGGTDIIGCFALGNPVAPVWRGELQCRALGLAVDVFDDDGGPLRGGKGELVCTNAFPSMPVGFWNDPDGGKYLGAYFERFPGIWHHGDYVELTEHGGMIIHGRSDATLNPGGVRIGTAEIYRQVEQLDFVQEAIVIGQEFEDDIRVVLFVILRGDRKLDDTLCDQIRAQIRANCTPRHVPARIVQVADIPRTKSGKITELAVRDVVHGREVKNVEALANPEALDQFKNLEELRG